MLVEKRNGKKEYYKLAHIYNALKMAATKLPDMTELEISIISSDINRQIKSLNLKEMTVEEIESIIYSHIKDDYPALYNSYKAYNEEHEKIRMMKTALMKSVKATGNETDRDNANVGNNFSAKMLRIASETNKYFNLATMPRNLAKLHEQGDLYYHDLDSFNLTVNCLHIPTARLLDETFNTGYGTTNKPKSIEVASSLSCILLQASQNDMFGGQSHPNFDNDLAPYVGITRDKATINRLAFNKLSKLSDSTLLDIELLMDKACLDIRHLATDLEFKNIRDKVNTKDPAIAKALGALKGIVKSTEDEFYSGNFKLTAIDRLEIKSNVYKACRQAMQSVVYNLNTMHSRAGSQVPFSSLNIGIPDSEDAAMLCQMLLEEYEKGLGKGEQPIFPNIIFRVKKGINRGKGAPYEYLYKIACRVAGKRMNPTFMNIDADFNLKYYNQGILPATMGCRTYLCSNVNGEEGPVGRGNNAPTTIDLPRIALNVMRFKPKEELGSEEAINDFMDKLDKMIELAKDSLLYRYSVLKHLKVKDLPFSLGQHLIKGSENLDQQDSIEPILKSGTWGIGFIGLAETLKVLTGKHHGESAESQELGLRIVSRIRELCDIYTQQYKLNFSCYATPAEGLSSKFTVKDEVLFGNIPWIISKGYYTNSFHVPVDYKISIKQKLEIEAPYHKLCNGGHISYIEFDGPVDEEVVEKIISTAYDTTNISYMGINFHLRYCKNCGNIMSNPQSIVCPKCHSNDFQGISRVTGYLSLDERFGPGKELERANRTIHMGSIGDKGYTLI